MIENLSLFLASRQKRLSYWADRFKANELPVEAKTRVLELMKKYAQKLSQAALAEDRGKQNELCEEIRGLDRVLNSVFEDRRLLTSELGIAAMTDCSTRGKGGSSA